MKRSIILSAALLSGMAVAGCSTVAAQDEGELRVREPDSECDASDVQEFVGQRASEEMGAILLARSGAKVLRWVPPNTAITMDYRFDRLTVSYDDDMIIERISCG